MNGKPLIEQFHDSTFSQLESERQVKLTEDTKSLLKRASETWGSLGVALIFFFMKEYGAREADAIIMSRNWIKEQGGPDF